MTTKTATKRPRRSTTGWKYEAVPSGTGAFISGPDIDCNVYSDNVAEAEMIAAALNFSTNFEAINRQAIRLAAELEYLTEFKTTTKEKP